MTLETNRLLGGIGAILMVIGPFLGAYTGLLGLIGLILVLIALKGLSSEYNEGGIFNNALYGVILVILGGVVFVALIVVAAVGFLSDIGIDIHELSDWSDPNVFQQINWEELVTLDTILPYIGIVVGALVVLFIFVVIAAIFLRKSLTSLSAKTGVGLFGTTGMLILIGAILTIIAIGFILLWIALILLAVAFFSIRARPAEPTTAAQPP